MHAISRNPSASWFIISQDGIIHSASNDLYMRSSILCILYSDILFRSQTFSLYQISILTVCIHMSKEDEYKQGFSHNVFQQIFEAGYMGTCTCLSNIEAWEVIHVGWLAGWLAYFLGLLAFGSTSLFYRMWPREQPSMVGSLGIERLKWRKMPRESSILGSRLCMDKMLGWIHTSIHHLLQFYNTSDAN